MYDGRNTSSDRLVAILTPLLQLATSGVDTENTMSSSLPCARPIKPMRARDFSNCQSPVTLPTAHCVTIPKAPAPESRRQFEMLRSQPPDRAP